MSIFRWAFSTAGTYMLCRTNGCIYTLVVQYLIYLSKTKLDMLGEQLTARSGKSAKLDLGFNWLFLKGGVEIAKETAAANHDALRRIEEEIPPQHVGTIEDPSAYVKDTLKVRYGRYGTYYNSEKKAYDDYLCIFLGAKNTKRVSLIGSASSLIGEVDEPELPKALDVYVRVFMRRLRRDFELDTLCDLDDLDAFIPKSSPAIISKLHDNFEGLEAEIEFLGRRIFEHEDGIVISPIYVGYSD